MIYHNILHTKCTIAHFVCFCTVLTVATHLLQTKELVMKDRRVVITKPQQVPQSVAHRVRSHGPNVAPKPFVKQAVFVTDIKDSPAIDTTIPTTSCEDSPSPTENTEWWRTDSNQEKSEISFTSQESHHPNRQRDCESYVNKSTASEPWLNIEQTVIPVPLILEQLLGKAASPSLPDEERVPFELV